jgi:hypothetical protein
MAAAFKRIAGRTLTGPLRDAAPMIVQVAAGIAACGLWIGVASPNLQLLPGVNASSDQSVEIALQSALLGIDDGSSRSASAVLAASYADLPSPDQLRGAAATPWPRTSLVVNLSDSLAADGSPAAGRWTLEPDRPVGLVDPPGLLADAPVPPEAPGSPGVGSVVAAPAGSGGQAGGGATEQPLPRPAAPKADAAPTAAVLDQQIMFDATLPATAYVGGTLTVSASASSGLPVTLSVKPGSNVCRLAGSSLKLRATGVCTLEARQPGNARYKDRRVEGSFDVVRAPQTISFVDPAPADAVVGERSYPLEARATSGLAVILASLTPDVCALSGTTVRTIGAGGCTIEAHQAGNDTFEPAAAVQLAFEVHEPVHSPHTQTITFSSTAPAGALVGGAAYVVSVAASSGLPVDLSVDASSVGVCAGTGNLVSFIGEGTCTISARQAGGHGFLAAPTTSQSFLVGRAPQAVSFLSTPPATAVAGLTTYLVVASSSASLPVTLSVAQSSAAVCALSGAIVTVIAAGTCAVEADQPGDTAYQPAPQAVQSFSVGSATPSLSVQTINFTSTPPASAVVGGPDYALNATATSGLPVAFSAAASSAGICTVTGSAVALVGAGTCTIAADQSGSTAYAPAASVQQSFVVSLAAQAISFTSVPPAPAAAGGADYSVAAAATSGLPVTFSLAPASAGICLVTGAAVSLLADGTCTIFADQAGAAGHAAAARVAQSFTIGSGPASTSPQTISFTTTAPTAAATGGSYTVAASASSGLPVSYAIAPASAGVCALTGGAVSFVGTGTCTVLADQPGNVSYDPAPQASQSFGVSPPPPALQTIGFTSIAPSAAVYGGAPYAVTATASSGLPVVFSIPASSNGICTLSGSTVAFVGGGTCTISANQAGSGSYAPAPQAQQSFTVARAAQTITITSTPPAVDKHSPPYTITAAATSGLGVSFSVAAESSTICSVSGASVTFLRKGDCVVNANQGGNTQYLPAPQAQQTIVVLAHA